MITVLSIRLDAHLCMLRQHISGKFRIYSAKPLHVTISAITSSPCMSDKLVLFCILSRFHLSPHFGFFIILVTERMFMIMMIMDITPSRLLAEDTFIHALKAGKPLSSAAALQLA